MADENPEMWSNGEKCLRMVRLGAELKLRSAYEGKEQEETHAHYRRHLEEFEMMERLHGTKLDSWDIESVAALVCCLEALDDFLSEAHTMVAAAVVIRALGGEKPGPRH